MSMAYIDKFPCPGIRSFLDVFRNELQPKLRADSLDLCNNIFTCCFKPHQGVIEIVFLHFFRLKKTKAPQKVLKKFFIFRNIRWYIFDPTIVATSNQNNVQQTCLFFSVNDNSKSSESLSIMVWFSPTKVFSELTLTLKSVKYYYYLDYYFIILYPVVEMWIEKICVTSIT